MADPSEEKIKTAANVVADKLDADVLLVNYQMLPPIDFAVIQTVSRRKVRKNLFLILVTEGGSADSAFRIMRTLQGRYEKITVVVPGWCKSAGTLMCIGGHELQIGDLGELGPLDVQIVKADEMDEQKSGLAVETAFEKLQQESFKLFIQHVRDLGATEYRITLKTAAEIAQRLTVGAIAPIFEKLDPTTIGEDYRSNRLAQAYAERLNLKSKNLVRRPDFNALDMLLSGYPSHGFVIDRTEAQSLFKNVDAINGDVATVVSALGIDAIMPRNRLRDQSPKLEYLNDELEQPTEEPVSEAVSDSVSADLLGSDDAGNGARDVPGHPEEGSRKRKPGKEAQRDQENPRPPNSGSNGAVS